jgi:hypothetical protein
MVRGRGGGEGGREGAVEETKGSNHQPNNRTADNREREAESKPMMSAEVDPSNQHRQQSGS